MKKGFQGNIETLTTQNTDFRRVLYTGQFMQLVLMSLAVGEEIGSEVHEDIDQFFRVEEGRGTVVIDGVEHAVADDDVVIVPAGAQHNVINTGTSALKLYTLYAPPEHKHGTVHATQAIAQAQHEADHFDGVTSE